MLTLKIKVTMRIVSKYNEIHAKIEKAAENSGKHRLYNALIKINIDYLIVILHVKCFCYHFLRIKKPEVYGILKL